MAVSRRQKENDTFNDIASTLPIEENAKELDKASVLRLAINYLKLRDILADCEEPATDLSDLSDITENSDDKLQRLVPNFSKDVLQALDGFLVMVSKDGRILYATESISQYLGLRQVDVIGVHLQDIIHPQDYSEVATIFQSQGHDIGPEIKAFCKEPLRRNFVVRMRCAFTPSVRSITRCSNFKPIYCSGYVKFSNKKIKEGEFIGMVMLCKLASAMKVKELCVGAFFKTKHGLDLGYTAVDTRIRWILGFDPAEMIGLKAYNYFHPEDLTATSSCHTTLLAKGQSHSPCYRFMTRSGDWVWVKSKSCVTYDAMTHLPNGLSIYTWIVRYDEEDDRMKAIAAGEDPGNLGIKETSSLVSSLSSTSGSINIQELCNPLSSSPKMEQQSVSCNQTISPRVMTTQPPPNINPFQSTPPQSLSPPSSCGTSGGSHDPFMGVSPTSSINSVQLPSNYSCGQMESREHSPSYLSSSANTSGGGYLTPLTSPSNCSSPPDSCYYTSSVGNNSVGGNYNSPAHSPFPLPPHLSMPHPPHGFNNYNGVTPPYVGVQQQLASSFAVSSTVYNLPNDIMSHQSFMLGPPPPPHTEYNNIKQEPDYHHFQTDYSNCYYGDGRFNKTTPTSSHVKDARTRYMNIGKMASGVRPHPPMTDLDAIAINDISEWLQHSVH